MKFSFLLTALLLSTALPSPAQMNYQGRLTGPAGAPLADGQRVLEFSLWDAATGGTQVWGPYRASGGTGPGLGPQADLVNGYFNVVIANQDTAGRSLTDAMGTAASRYLQIQVAGNSPVSPRQLILASPRALSSDTSVKASVSDALMATRDCSLNGKILFLIPDPNHGLGYNALPSAAAVDGPVLFGYSSGGLGTTQYGARMALRWDSNNDVSVPGRLSAGTAAFSTAALTVSSTSNVGTANNAQFTSTNVGPNYSYIHWGSTGDIYWRSASPSGKVVLQDQGGNVAIGVYGEYPSAKVHVRVDANDGNPALLKLQRNGTDISGGTADWSFRIQNNRNLELFSFGTYLKGWFTEADGAYRTASDRRLKQDITPLAPVLDRVLKLEPVSYHFKSTPDAKEKTVGFIAQDVQPLFPEVVSKSGEYYGVGYSEFAPITVAAIKELNTKLEKENADLRARLDRLERLVLKERGDVK